jgi:nucleotide-binding universal stress UspA family protein
MPRSHLSSAVIVGVDGSESALRAALWAIDEAVSRDIPLRLVCAVEPRVPETSRRRDAQDFEAAELVVRQAMTTVESTGKPVKIEAVVV